MFTNPIETTVDSLSNTIKSVQLLSGYSANRRLYDDLDTVINKDFWKGV